MNSIAAALLVTLVSTIPAYGQRIGVAACS